MSTLRHALGLAGAGALALSLAACGGSEPVSPEGTWGEDGEGLPQLTFEADGVLTGTDGCNRLSGTWEIDGETVEFGPLISTLMACEGVDTWLAQGASATIDGDVLTVLDEEGNEIGTLEKSE